MRGRDILRSAHTNVIASDMHYPHTSLIIKILLVYVCAGGNTLDVEDSREAHVLRTGNSEKAA